MIVHFNKRPLLASYLSHGILSAELPTETECLMKSTCHVPVLHTQRLTQYNAASPLAISAAAIPRRINLSIWEICIQSVLMPYNEFHFNSCTDAVCHIPPIYVCTYVRNGKQFKYSDTHDLGDSDCIIWEQYITVNLR